MKYYIALEVMPAWLIGRGFSNNTPSSKLVDYARTFKNHDTDQLAVLIARLLRGERPSPDQREKVAQFVYELLREEVARASVEFSPTLRRRIGNLAKKIEMQKAQLIEFFRLLYIDIVNHELR